jgi:hypothetical protein
MGILWFFAALGRVPPAAGNLPKPPMLETREGREGDDMSSARQYADRDFFSDRSRQADREELRRLLAESEVAEAFEPAAQRRLGEMISDSMRKSLKPGW